MSFLKSLDSVEQYKQHLWSLTDKQRTSAESPYFLRRNTKDAELPNYAIAFIAELAGFSNPQSHLDPFASIYSPSMAVDLGATTSFFIDEAQSQLAKTMTADRCINITIGDGLFLLDTIVEKYDLITSFPPFGWTLKPEDKKLLQSPFSGTQDKSNLLIYKSLNLLSEDGVAIFIVPNRFFLHGNIEPVLERCGFYVDAIFSLAAGELSTTYIDSNIIILKRTSQDFTFFAELSDDSLLLQQIIDSYQTRTAEGVAFLIPRGSYKGAPALKLNNQIEALETQYKSYSAHKLGDISEMATCQTGGIFTEKKNTVYVPKIGKSKPIVELAVATMKHQNYLELKFDSTIVLASYMQSFFRSLMGSQYLESGKQGHIPTLSLTFLRGMMIPIPSLSEQRDIIATMSKLSNIKEKLTEFEDELSLNPTTSTEVLGQLDKMVAVIEGLTAADKIRSMIRNGESASLEFKETLSWNIHSQQKDIAMETACLKTIVGFLNAHGGILLIGVADDGSIPGVNFEVGKLHKNNIDKFQTSLKTLLKERIGAEFYPYFDVTIDHVGQAQVVRVNCRPSTPCFLINKQTKQEDFYVRAPAATDKLEGRKLIEYIEHHWPK